MTFFVYSDRLIFICLTSTIRVFFKLVAMAINWFSVTLLNDFKPYRLMELISLNDKLSIPLITKTASLWSGRNEKLFTETKYQTYFKQ